MSINILLTLLKLLKLCYSRQLIVYRNVNRRYAMARSRRDATVWPARMLTEKRNYYEFCTNPKSER